MVSLYDFDAKTHRRRLCASKSTPYASSVRFRADRAKALVMKHLGQLVADGFAQWNMLDNEEIQFRFNTGETFLLSETGIIRLE
jgi:hypothetical protein